MSTLTCTVVRGVTLTEDADGLVQITKDRLNLLGLPTVTLALSGAVATADIADDAVTAAKISDALSDILHSAPTFVIGAEAGNEIAVTVQLNDAKAEALSAIRHITWWLSDTAGAGVSGTTPDGDIVYDKGTSLIEHTADLFGQALTNATGEFDITIGESAADTWYLNIAIGGVVYSSGAITFA